MNAKTTALGMAVLKYLMDTVRPAIADLREQINAELESGDRVAISSPIDGSVIGSATKSRPKPKAGVTDRAKLLEWMRDNYPDRVHGDYEFDDEGEVLRVLLEHAPHLVKRYDFLPDFAIEEVLKLSEKAGQPVGPGGELDVPGIEVTVPEGNTSIRLEADAPAAIEALIVGGVVALDGQVREIEAGA